MGFKCELCQKEFSFKWNLTRHIQSVHGENVRCDICGKQLCRKDKLMSHKKICHTATTVNQDLICVVCSKKFSKQEDLLLHFKTKHTVNIIEPIASSSSKSKGISDTKFCNLCKEQVLKSQ